MAIIILLILGVILGPPLLLVFIGISRQKENPDKAKLLYIAAAVYLLISGSACASLLMDL